MPKASVAGRLTALGAASALAVTGGWLVMHEGTVLGTYVDPVGIVTACHGRVRPEFELGMTFTERECDQMLLEDLLEHDRQLMSVVQVNLTQGEHQAYLSFHYNVGHGSFRNSTLLQLLNEGQRVEACKQLPRWVYARGVQLPGLVNRRADEMAMCLRDLLHGYQGMNYEADYTQSNVLSFDHSFHWPEWFAVHH